MQLLQVMQFSEGVRSQHSNVVTTQSQRLQRGQVGELEGGHRPQLVVAQVQGGERGEVGEGHVRHVSEVAGGEVEMLELLQR